MKLQHILKPEWLPLYLGVVFIIIIASLSLLFSASPTAGTSTVHSERLAVADMRMLQLNQTSSVTEAMDELESARVVLVGETHDRYDHHMVQLEVLKQMHRQSPEIAIGVEWFQQPYQQHLDDFIAGHINEKEMLHRTGYFERWRYDYRLYRMILRYAREQGIPVIALNASKELTHALSESDFDELDDALRAELPTEYDWSNKAYEQYLRELYSMHPESSNEFEGFLRVQLTWDESMAERAAEFLDENPGHRMLILAGSGHVMHGWGIPERVQRRTGIKPVTVLVTGDELTVSAGIADYLVMSLQEQLEPVGLIGAFLGTSSERVVIKSFIKDSAIADTGIEEGSIIIGVDNTVVNTFADFKLAMLDKRGGDIIRLLYLEDEDATDDEHQSIEIELR